MHRFASVTTLALAVMLTAFVAGCSGEGGSPLVTVRVDPTLAPSQEALPGFEDGAPRPLAVATDIDGGTATFVANELWVATDDTEALEALVARWDGEVLDELHPGEVGVPDLPSQYLVRVDASGADVSLLGEHIRGIDPDVTGDYRVSSDEGLALLTAAAEEVAEGRPVGVNWVGEGSGVRDRELSDAPSGPAGYDPNPFTWPSHDLDATQAIGVAEAWRAMDLAGRLDNRIDLAILDMGFAPDADTPDDWVAISNVPAVDPIDRDNILDCGDPCPWHGTNVVSAAMAVPDNGFGSAGPAGPVARPIMVFTLYDFFTSITALAEAKALGAEVANMSYEAPVPDFVAWSTSRFVAATAAFRASGMLLFAAAGNDGRNVNAERCVHPFGIEVCWERRFHTPCQNPGVLCVGGVGHDSLARHGNSNFGDSVDLFAPYVQWLGPDPDHPTNETRGVNGTSMSSPFVAGIAALVWAADPSAGADLVADRLFDAARPSDFVEVSSYVNAYDAVLAALGSVPPSIAITNPAPGGQTDLNRPAGLRARAVDVEDGDDCCVVTWTSEADGLLGTTEGPAHNLSHVFDSVGPQTVTAEVVDSDGETAEDTITFDVVNTPPSIEILRPEPGEEVPRGVDVVLRGSSDDPNEPGFSLDCDRMTWTSSVGSDPFPVTGCDAQVTFPDLGTRTLTLTGTDPQGASGSDTVTIEVVPPPDVIPPTVQILEPDGSAIAYGLFEEIAFEGSATDDSGTGELEFEWFASHDGTRQLIGTTPTFSWAPEEILGTGFCGGTALTIELEVTDPDGATGSDAVDIDILHVC